MHHYIVFMWLGCNYIPLGVTLVLFVFVLYLYGIPILYGLSYV